MHILVTGAAGMIGRKLVAQLVTSRSLNGRGIERLTLLDVAAPAPPQGFTGKIETVAVDLAAQGSAATAIEGRPDVIFHLAAVVSGEAERDFDKGMRCNFD